MNENWSKRRLVDIGMEAWYFRPGFESDDSFCFPSLKFQQLVNKSKQMDLHRFPNGYPRERTKE